MGIIEQWGTGLQRMIRGCREYGVRDPEFIDMGDAFRVIFFRSKVRTSTEITNTGTESETTGTESEATGTESGITGIEMAENELLITLSDTEKKIVSLILKNPEVTQDKMAQVIGMSKNGIRYTMGKLKKRGILEREGATKKGKWSINL